MNQSFVCGVRKDTYSIKDIKKRKKLFNQSKITIAPIYISRLEAKKLVFGVIFENENTIRYFYFYFFNTEQ